MIFLNNIFFTNLEYNIINQHDKYSVKLYDQNENLWYGSNSKSTYDINYNSNVNSYLFNNNLSNIKINNNHPIKRLQKNIIIMFHINVDFIVNNHNVLNDPNNFIVFNTFENIYETSKLLKLLNCKIPDMIYCYEHEYTCNMHQLSKKILSFLKNIFLFEETKIFVINTNIYYNIELKQQKIYNENVIITENIDEVDINDNLCNVFYLKTNSNTIQKYKDTLKDLLEVSFYI